MKYSLLYSFFLFLWLALLLPTKVSSAEIFPAANLPEAVQSKNDNLPPLDSLRVQVRVAKKTATEKTATEKTKRIEATLRMVRSYAYVNADSAFHYYNELGKAILEWQDGSWDDAYYTVTFDLASIAQLGHERLYTLLTQVAAYAEDKGDLYILMHAYRKLSQLFYHASKLDQAHAYQFKAMRVTRLPEMPAYARILPYISLAFIYGDHPDGELYADTAMTMMGQGIALPPRASHWLHTHIGAYLQGVGREDEALYNFERALDVMQANEELVADPNVYLGLGRAYAAKQEYITAKDYFRHAQNISDQHPHVLPEVKIDIAEAMIDLARKTKQPEIIEEYALEIVDIAVAVDYLKPLMLAHRTLYEHYADQASSKKAAVHLKTYFELRDALNVREKANTDYFQARALELAEKRNRVAVVEANLRLQTNRFITQTVILLFTSMLLIFFYFSRKNQKKHNAILSAKNKQISESNKALVAINEQLHRAKKKAEESHRLKTSILQNMSHETRTPLTSILGYAEMLVENAENSPEIALHIQRGGRRLMDTLTSVLDLAQLEGGEAELAPEIFDITKLVHESLEALHPMADNKGVELCFVVKGLQTINVDADRKAVARVLDNLIRNGVCFTNNGRVNIQLERSAKDVVLSIEDTGVGMDSAFLPHAFDPFRQESSGHGRIHEGVGLGLPITKHLVELMNGRITVVSEKGAGSTFTLTLPIAANL